MAGYTPWMAGAAAAAKRTNAVLRVKSINECREEYAAYRAEELACGYEPETFEQYFGPNLCSQLGLVYRSPREQAEARVMGGQSYGEWHHTADMF